MRTKIVVAGVFCAVFFWFFDAFVDSFFFRHDTFLSELLSPEPVEIWVRSFVFLIFVLFSVYVSFLLTKRKEIEAERERLIVELQDALSKVKTLSGFLPICSSCKKIRDDKGYWNQIEKYIREHSEAEFSHSICPECARELYPEYYKEKK